jgi:hypothetical protein
MQRSRKNLLAVVLTTSLVVVNVAATCLAVGHKCCGHCGCEAECRKVCQLVCEEKKVEVICWGCQCEDFCLPGPGTPGCTHCEQVCADCNGPCDCTKPHAEPKRFLWTSWLPSCGELHTKKKLMKKVVTKKVPTYKYVVEDLCATCAAGCEEAPSAPETATAIDPASVR